LAFFESPERAFDFKEQHDFDLHIALEVDRSVLEPMMAKGKAAGIETRGIADHHFIDSIYFRDPNGYVIELTAKRDNHDAVMKPGTNGATRNFKPGRRQKASVESARRPEALAVGFVLAVTGYLDAMRN